MGDCPNNGLMYGLQLVMTIILLSNEELSLLVRYIRSDITAPAEILGLVCQLEVVETATLDSEESVIMVAKVRIVFF